MQIAQASDFYKLFGKKYIAAVILEKKVILQDPVDSELGENIEPIHCEYVQMTPLSLGTDRVMDAESWKVSMENTQCPRSPENVQCL